MDKTLELAQLIVSCWRLADDQGTEEERIPTSHRILDRALKKTDDAFPQWARERLHFAESRVGTQCIELRSILDCAQEADLTEAPNPSYQSTQIKVSGWVAKRLLNRLDISEDQARNLGRLLRQAVHEVKVDDEQFASATG